MTDFIDKTLGDKIEKPKEDKKEVIKIKG